MTFFAPFRKRWWKVMPMEALHADPKCVSIMMNLKIEWDTLSKERGSKNVASKIIVDSSLMYGRSADQLLYYFITVLDFLKHHRATLKLKKCKWFQYRCEFVGMDMKAGGTQPAKSKNEAFDKLERPDTW